MKFNKYSVAWQLSHEGMSRKEIEKKLYNRNFISDSDETDRFRENLQKESIHVISCNESLYPEDLKEIYNNPLVIFGKGDITLLNKRMITIVGTREMSVYGRWVVRYILRAFVGKDVVIVSGLANGIDSEVHKVCLEFDIKTLAVVAGGIDRGYPKKNQEIYDQITKKGLIISEFPLGREIVKGMFPMRNRILAGISSATVLIESDIRGGSLITMNLALEYGKDIFCVPCNINRYSLQGCNMCIEQGAIPLYSSSQLLKFYKKCTT